MSHVDLRHIHATGEGGGGQENQRHIDHHFQEFHQNLLMYKLNGF
jgi:hypothetical protein